MAGLISEVTGMASSMVLTGVIVKDAEALITTIRKISTLDQHAPAMKFIMIVTVIV